MPPDACVLSVGVQPVGYGSALRVWALVNPEQVDNPEHPMVARRFHVASTGGEFEWNVNLRFLGTVHTPEGLVFHVFEQTH